MILESLLAETFGLSADDPKVKGVVHAMKLRRIVDPKRIEIVERDLKIDRLRAEGYTAADIATRVGMSRETVTRIVQAQLKIRRAL
jgi:AraC-like DNA-binding protein